MPDPYDFIKNPWGFGKSDPKTGGVTDAQLAAILSGGGSSADSGYGPPEGWVVKIVGNRQIVWDPVSKKEVDISSVPKESGGGGGGGAVAAPPTYNIVTRPVSGLPGMVGIYDADSGEYLGMKEDSDYISPAEKERLLYDKAQTTASIINSIINAGALDETKAKNLFDSEMAKYEAQIDSWYKNEDVKLRREDASVDQQIALAGQASQRGADLMRYVAPSYVGGDWDVPGWQPFSAPEMDPNAFYKALGAPMLGDIKPIDPNVATPPPVMPDVKYTPAQGPGIDYNKILAALGVGV